MKVGIEFIAPFQGLARIGSHSQGGASRCARAFALGWHTCLPAGRLQAIGLLLLVAKMPAVGLQGVADGFDVLERDAVVDFGG